MSSELAIQVQDLSKVYQIYAKPQDRLKQSLLPRLSRLTGRPPQQFYREFLALSNVSFDVAKGETVGIIGRNGSGKSTLLQIICGTLAPTAGTVRAHGRIAALLELGAGFDPEFTGSENVRMSCALLGLSPAETDARFDDILAFADIGDFVDQPVKTYSSGMFVRLAFAVNIVSRPDIMVVDEALAVGDMSFQAKCMTALTRIQEAGATVLFVSHDVGAVRSLCSRAIYLERGAVKAIGKASEVAEAYVRVMREEMTAAAQAGAVAASSPSSARPAPATAPVEPPDFRGFSISEEFHARVQRFRYGRGGARITNVELLDQDGQPTRQVDFDQQVSIVVSFETEIDDRISCNYYVADAKRNLVLGSGMDLPGYGDLACKSGGRYVVAYTTRLPLSEGRYLIELELTKDIVADQSAEFLDVISDAVVFTVVRKPNGRIWAQVYVPNTIEVIHA